MDFRDKRYHFEPGEYNGKRVIWIRFEKDNQLISYLRNHTKARWSASEKSWYITDNRYYRELFGLKPVIAGKEVLRKIHAKNLPALKRFQEQIIHRPSNLSGQKTAGKHFSKRPLTVRAQVKCSKSNKTSRY